MHSMQYNCRMETPHRSVGYLINRISRVSQRWLDARLKQHDLSSAAVPVLVQLQTSEALTQKELASHIGIEQPTMAQLLNRMERNGLVVRVLNPDDGRSAHVSLTKRAESVLPAVRREIHDGNSLVMEGFSEQDMASLTRLLERYLANVEKQLE